MSNSPNILSPRDVLDLVQIRDMLRQKQDPRADKIDGLIQNTVAQMKAQNQPPPQQGLYEGMTSRILGTTQPFTDLGQMIAHPIETAKQVPSAVAGIPEALGAGKQVEALHRIVPSFKAGHYGDTVGSTFEAFAPIVGPVAERIGSGIGTASVTGNYTEPMRDVAAIGYAGLAGKLAPEVPGAIRTGLEKLSEAKGAALPLKQGANLAAAAEMGGRAPKGVTTYEDVARPILGDFQEQAIKQGIKPSDFVERKGYDIAKSITEGTRTEYDQAYRRLIDPIKPQPASASALAASQDLIAKMGSDAKLLDELAKSGNTDKLVNLANRVAQARTIGDLDSLRISLNRLASKFESKTGEAQYQAPLFQESLSEAANSIRNQLYNDVAYRYRGQVSEADIRNLQKNHGAAIQLDNLMEQTRNEISRRASEEAAPASLKERLKGSSYRLTMQPRHAAGGLIEKIFPPSEVKLFNTRMGRVIEGPTVGANPLVKAINSGEIKLTPPKGLLTSGALPQGPSPLQPVYGSAPTGPPYDVPAYQTTPQPIVDPQISAFLERMKKK